MNSGLSLARNRAYEPLIGRWLNKDPIDDLKNPYAYVLNDPIALVDPAGTAGSPPAPPQKPDKICMGTPFRNCLSGTSDPGCCGDNLQACQSLNDQLQRLGIIDQDEWQAIEKCCNQNKKDCDNQYSGGNGTTYYRINWEDCFEKWVRFLPTGPRPFIPFG